MSIELKTAWLGRSFECLEELDSTNEYLKANAFDLPHGAAVIAKRQTAGKGRLGRNWQDSGNSLALSVLLHGQSIERLAMLPLVAGVAVSDALQSLTGESFPIKWSNDVLFGDKKICGILCESKISGGNAFAVIGIGVNLAQTREDFDCLGLVYATSLKLATGKSFEILPVAYGILNKFEPIIEDFQKKGFEAIREKYKKRCVTLGREVRVISGVTEQTGFADDIAEDGGLVLKTSGGVKIIRAGEASVRGLYGYV